MAFLVLRPVASLVDGSVASLVNVRVAALVMAVPVLVGAVFITRHSRNARPSPSETGVGDNS
ncbi:MAG: hypothetical protein J4G11_11960 [Acidimicrobiia bacterium]|nr:hypothetical protein [Acidimicrobiia bacterium]